MPEIWEDEPDALDWTSDTGFRCSIRRVAGMGHLCGYVAVPAGHPWNGENYNRIDACPHGGLTYGSAVVDPVHANIEGCEPGDFVVGFDCAHSGDLVPKMATRFEILWSGEIYRDIEFVRYEVEQLAQAAAKARVSEDAANG